MLVKLLGFLKKTEILCLHCIKMSSKTPVKILGYFIRTMFLTPKNHVLLLLVKILGLLKNTEILGLHRIEILGLAHVKILGYFIRTIFLTQNNPWPTFACQNLGLFEECKDIGPTLYQNSRINTCRNLGYFLRTRFLTPKTHCLYGLSKSWGFKRERRYWAYIVSKFQVKHPSKSWLFNKNHVSWRQKNMAYFAYQNLGISNENRDFGPILYQDFK